MNKKLVGFSSLLLAGITYGSFGVWIRLLSRELSMYQQIVFRNIVALVFAVAFIIIGKRLTLNLQKIKKINLILYALVVPLAVIFYNISMLRIKIAVTTFGFYIGSIIFSFVLGTFLFKEKVTPVKILSLLLVAFGLACFTWPLSRETLNFGFLAAVISSLFDSISNALRKNLAGKVDKFILVFITTVGGVVISGLMMVYFKQTFSFFTHIPTNTWLTGICFGFILAAVNYLLLLGFQNFDLSLGVIVLSSELIFALLFGLIFLNERPLPKEMLGGLLVMLAIIVPNINFPPKKLETLA